MSMIQVQRYSIAIADIRVPSNHTKNYYTHTHTYTSQQNALGDYNNFISLGFERHYSGGMSKVYSCPIHFPGPYVTFFY